MFCICWLPRIVRIQLHVPPVGYTALLVNNAFRVGMLRIGAKKTQHARNIYSGRSLLLLTSCSSVTWLPTACFHGGAVQNGAHRVGLSARSRSTTPSASQLSSYTSISPLARTSTGLCTPRLYIGPLPVAHTRGIAALALRGGASVVGGSMTSRTSHTLLSPHTSISPLARTSTGLCTPRLYIGPLPVAHTRGIAALALRGGASVVGALLAFVLIQALQRQDWNQKRRMRGVFRSLPSALAAFKPGPLFLPRAGKVQFTREITDADPSGPIVVTGPVGSGKTMVLKKALANRPHTLYFSLRATPVTSGDSLARALVTQAGYLMPPTELLSRAIFNRDMASSQNMLAEIDRALQLVNEVLEEEKARGWIVETPGESPMILPPLICIDELNLNEVGSGLLDDSNFWKLIDWAMHISDNRLGQVIFGCGLDVAEMLDSYPGFRMRRTKIHYDFPRPSTVHSYLTQVVNPFLRNTLGAKERSPPATASNVDDSTAAVGHEMASTSSASTVHKDGDVHPSAWWNPFARFSWKRGQKDQDVSPLADRPPEALTSSVIDATPDAPVESDTAKDATGAPSDTVADVTASEKPAAATASQRLMPWEFDARIDSTDPDRDYRTTSPTLHTLEPWEIDRIVDVIGGQLKDIDAVVSAVLRGKHWAVSLERLIADSCDLVENTLDEILTGAAGSVPSGKSRETPQMSRSRPGSRLGLRGYAQPGLPSVDYAVNPTSERLSLYARYLRGWSLLTALSQRKYIPKRDIVAKYFAECPHELDFFIDAGLIMSINVKTSAKMHVDKGFAGSITPSHGVASPTPVFGVAGTTSLTLPGTYLSASSPRMRVAFRVLTADPKLRLQTQRVAACVALARLRQDEERLLKRTQEVTTERTFAAQQLSLLLARDTALRGSVTKEMMSVLGNLQPAPDKTGHMVDQDKGALWGLALPLSEELPPLGMQALNQALRRAERVVRQHDEEMAAIRSRLMEIRGAMVVAQRKAEVAIPGTESFVGQFGVASDATARALGASIAKDALNFVDTDSDASDEEDRAWAWANTLPRRSRRAAPVSPSIEEQKEPADAETPKTEEKLIDEAASTGAPAPGWSSLEVYRGNTARSIQMYSNTGGYVYRNGSWEYVSGQNQPSSRTPDVNSSAAQAQESSSDHGYNPYGGYRWWL